MTLFLVASLACWRLTSLLVYEDGPGDAFKRFRAWAAVPRLRGLLDCFWCVSVWAAVPLAALAWWPDGRLMTLGWLAVSTAAIVMDELLPVKEERNGSI